MLQNNLFSLEQAIDPQPLTVSFDTPLHAVISLMHEWGNGHDGSDPNSENASEHSNSSCVLVVKDDLLQGIFTERDLVKLVAFGTDIKSVSVGEMMTQGIVTLTPSGSEDVFTALKLLRENSVRHLPVVDKNRKPIGLITAKSLRQKLAPKASANRFDEMAQS